MKKPAPAGRKKKVGEQEFVRKAISKAAGVTFEVVPPHPAFPLAVDRLDWFMRCRNREEIERAPYLNAAWREKRGGIWLESLAVGDTIDWIELAYGEEQAGKSLDLDYSGFEEPDFQSEFGRKFPIVVARVREYETVAAAASKRRRVHVELRRAGTKGMMVFTVAARLDVPKSASQRSLGAALAKGVSALREAYREIGDLMAAHSGA